MTPQELAESATKAMKQALKTVIADHKRLDLPLVVWQNGRIKRIKPWVKRKPRFVCDCKEPQKEIRLPSFGWVCSCGGVIGGFKSG